MAKSVNIPDVGTVNFPDEMDDDAITSAIESDILPSVKAQRATEPSRAAQYGSTALRSVQSHVAGLGRAVGQFGLAPEAAVKSFGANLGAIGAGGEPGDSLPEVDPMGNHTGSPMPVAADDAAIYQRNARMGAARQASDEAETERQAVRASGVQYGKVWSALEDANAAKQAEYDKALATEAPGMARSSKKVSDAQGFTGTLRAIAEDPLSTFGSLAGSIPDMLVGMGAGSLVSKAVALGLGPAAQAAALAARHETLLSAAKSPATFANANRLADEAAAQAYAKTIERGAVSVAGGTANAVEGAQSGYQTGQQVVDKLNERDPNTGRYAIGDDVLAKSSPRFAELIQRGESPSRARQLLGAELGDQATAMAAPWTMAMGKLTGAAGAEGRLIAGTGRLPLSTTLRNVGKETAEEGFQNIGEDFAGHNSRAQFDPNEPAFDAGGSFAQGIVGGFGLGASMHGGGHVAAMSRPAPSVTLAGQPIASFSDAELRGYADSGVLTGGVKEKVEGEITRRAGEKAAQGETGENGSAAAAPSSDQIDTAVQRFASAAGIAEPGVQASTTTPGSTPAPSTTTALANPVSVIPATPVTQASVQRSLEQEQRNANAIVPPPQEADTPGTPAVAPQPAGALDNLSNAAEAQRRAGVRLIIPDHGSSATLGVSNLESARTANDTGLVAGQADLDRSLAAARQRGQALDVPDLQPIQDRSIFRRAHAFAEVMQSISGVKPLLYHDPRPSAADGFELNGVPYINAGNLDQSIQHTAFHETYHVAETRAARGDKSAQQFVATTQTIFDMIGPEGRLDYATKYLFKNQVEAGQMTPEQALAHPALRSEMVADFFGQRADDQAWMASLAKRAPEHFGGFVRRWIDVLSKAIAGLRGKRADYGHKDIDSMIRKLNHAKAVAASALIEWRKSNPLLAGAVPKAGQTLDWRAEHEEQHDPGVSIEGLGADSKHQIDGLQTHEVPISKITLSQDVPQFKSDANANGVVEPLGGKFDRTGVAPIQLWQRSAGALEVISGRHRLDLAKRTGERTIPAQIHYEDQGFDVRHASALDAELNIRDGQGKVRDYVDYFKATGIDHATAEQRGLLARSIGRWAFAIASRGSDELIAAHRGGQLSDAAAVAIADAAPGDGTFQAVGIRAVQSGKTIGQAANTVRAVKLLAGDRKGGATGDLFGFDDSAMREAEDMARVATARQREIQARISAVSGAAKRPELAAAEGIDVKDAAAVLRRVEELKAGKAAWDNWTTNPKLVEEIRSELHPDDVQASPILSAYSAEDLKAKVEREANAPALDQRAQIDAEREHFQLQGQVQDMRQDSTGSLFDQADDIRHSSKQGEPWYSALERRLGAASMNSGPASGWKALVKGLVAKGDVKAAEVQWSGLDEWLDLQQGKVPKQAVLDYLAGNGVRVTEMTKGSGAALEKKWSINSPDDSDYYDVVTPDGAVKFTGSESEADRYIEHYDSGAPKFGQYQLPGGTNYREVLLTLPAKTRPVTLQEVNAARRKISSLLEPITQDQYDALASDGSLTHVATNPNANSYKSSHWDEPNVLAHIRLNDRTDSADARILFVEEVQSDFGQAGKKSGFQQPFSQTMPKIEASRMTVREFAEKQGVDATDWLAGRNAMHQDLGEPATTMGSTVTVLTENGVVKTVTDQNISLEEAVKKQTRGWQRILAGERQQHERNQIGKVPNAPFVTKTDAWVALALKRVIKLAVDEGYDKVAFVNGEQSADRYDLSKHVAELTAQKLGDNQYHVRAIDKTGNDLLSGRNDMSAEEVSSAIGKDVAERLIAKADASATEAQAKRDKYRNPHLVNEAVELTGLDLKVGGSGMLAFYDKIVPSVAKDVLKKLGGGALTPIQVSSSETTSRSREDAQRDGGRFGKWETPTMLTQPGFDITPAMRERAAEGMPLFSKKQTDEQRAANFKQWGNNAPVIPSSAAKAHVFKTGESVVVEAYHGTARPDRVGTVFKPQRATSGPMAFFTSEPALASSYAQGKQDTSLANEDQAYANWFKFKPPGARSAVSIDRAWYSLSPEVRAKVAERMPDIRTDDDGNVIYEKGGGDIGSYAWELKQTQRSYDRQGNPLKAATETWLTSGALYDQEEQFMKVLELAGIPKGQVEFDSPHSSFPFVYKTFIAMRNPLVTSDMPQSVTDALNTAAKKDRGRALAQGNDMWDKNTRTLRDWVQNFNDPVNKNAAYVWTSIPDKVTALFKSLGYDGIIDYSAKAGVGVPAPVYIPFQESQIKSALGNNGHFDSNKKDIRYSAKQVDTHEFKRWFGDSKVVDSEGRPLVVYHGTDRGSFYEFQHNKRSRSDGFVFTSNRDMAATYAANDTDLPDNGIKSGIYPAYLSAKNIKEINWGGNYFQKIDDGLDTNAAIAAAKAEGFDGLVIRNVNDPGGNAARREMHGKPGFDVMGDLYVVFDPKQVKSATGNRGTFDPTNPDIRFSRKTPPKPNGHRGVDVPEETKTEASRRVVQDQHIRMRKLREWALENGAQLTPASDTYRAETLMHGRTATRFEDFREKTVKPLVEATQKAGYTLDQVAEFLHAQHAEERNKQVAKVNQHMPDGGSGMDTAEAHQILRTAPAALKAMAGRWQAITTSSRDILLRSGIISQEQASAWDAAYKNYVPLKGGDESEASQRTGVGKGLSVNGKQKRALGHGARDEAIIENIMRDHERAIMLAEKNRVAQSMMLWLTEMGDERIGTVGEPVKRAVLVNSSAFDVRGAGLSVAAFPTRSEAEKFIRQQLSVKSPGAEKLKVVETFGDPSVQYRSSPMLEDHEAQAYVNGHAVRMQLNDTKLAQSFKRLSADQMGSLLETSRAINAYLSKAYTGYNPAFIPRNMIRDFGSGVIKLTGNFGAGTTAKIVARYPRALATLLRYSYSGTSTKSIDAYRTSGGSTGASYLGDLERIGLDIQHDFEKYQGVMEQLRNDRKVAAARVAAAKLVGGLVGWIEHLNAATENAMRLATFEQISKDTGSLDAGASAAKESTINFNRKGESGQMLGAMYLFYNPNVQDTASVIEALVRSKHKHQAQALVGAMVAIGYMAASLQWGGGDDDYERWKKISDNVRDRNLLIRTGEDTYKAIPVPFGFGFFHTLGNSIFAIQHGESANSVSVNMAANLFDHFSPVGNPLQGARGWDKTDPLMALGSLPGAPGTGELGRDVVRSLTNKSVFGGQIVPDSKFDEGRPDFLRLYRSTKGTIYDAITGTLSDLTGGSASQAGHIDVSPETLKFWTAALTGGTGVFLSDITHLAGLAARAALAPIDEDVSSLKPDLRELPIIRDYNKQESVMDARRAFWDAAAEVKDALADFKRALKAGDEAGMTKVERENGDVKALSNVAHGFGRMVKLARDRADEINADKNTSLAYKRGAIRQIEREETALYDDFLHRVTLAKGSDAAAAAGGQR